MRQYVFLYTAFLGSMLSGASLVHVVLKPNLALPSIEEAAEKLSALPERSAAGQPSEQSLPSAPAAERRPELR